MSNRHALHQAKRRDRLRNAKRHDISRNARRHRSITRAPTQSGSQRKAGPAAQTELRDPLLYSRCNNREAPLHALPSACSLRQTEASTISPAVRHMGAQDYPFRRKRTAHFARPGFVWGARIARFVHPWPKRAILARLRATRRTFSTIFRSWRAISPKNRTFMGYIPQRIVHLVQMRPK